MMCVFQMLKTALNHIKLLIALIVSFLIIYAAFFTVWQRAQKAEEQYRQAVVLHQEQLEQVKALSKALHISQINAKKLQAAYDELKAKPPVASFTVSAPSLVVAAEQVAERINKQDAALPPAALEKTDRTAVVKNDTDYKVDVLKINLDKAWEFSTGAGSHRSDTYIPLGVQRNYAPHKAVAAELHLVPEELAKGKIKTSGWEVRHVWRF
ncbi:MAG: YiiG family protein [Negativicutes bacterium]|nr:YiiG family protein [Negativicutes bacterium]